MTSVKSVAQQGALLLVFAALWEFASWSLGGDRLPDIVSIWRSLIQSALRDTIIQSQGGGDGGYIPHVFSTFSRWTIGFMIGVTCGFVVGLAIGQNRSTVLLFNPVLEVFRVIPPIIFIPFSIIVIPNPFNSQYITIAFYASFSVAIYVLNALENVPPNFLNLARLLGGSQARVVLDVQVPAVLPELLGGLRVTAVISLGISVVAEYMVAPSGIGRVMKYAMSFSDVDLIVVGIVWTVAIALLFDAFLILSFRHLLRWSPMAAGRRITARVLSD